jgi:hypothetical protein
VITSVAAESANLVIWPAGRPLVRCDNAVHGATSFNPSPVSMRFRPIYDDGEVVATAYAGEDGMIALAESVLREAALGADAVLPVARLRGIEIVTMTYAFDLALVQLNGPGVRKVGLRRADIVDTGPNAYPGTAQVAQILYDAQEGAQGIVWTSHQADHGDAAILWGTRLNSAELALREGPVALDSPHGLKLVQAACERLGVLLEY